MKRKTTLSAIAPRGAMALCACMIMLAVNAQRAKYWTGGIGAWSDASNWSLSAGGAGGAGEPRANEDAVITADERGVNVLVEGNVRCNALIIDGTRAPIVLSGEDGSIRIGGDWRMSGGVMWRFTGEVELGMREGGADIDTRGIGINSDVTCVGSGAWNVMTDLTLGDANTLTLREGSLITNTNTITAGVLRFEGRREKHLYAGSSVFMLKQAFEPGGARGVVEQGRSHLLVNDHAAAWGDAAINDREEDRNSNTCGTGPGQTPFTINAQLVSNYNGFGVSCSGACDAIVTVTVSGGIGPFAISWSGGPNTQTWNNTCVGNKLVVVTDQGQGIGCATTVQVTGPAPLSVIFFPSITPPTCAQVCNGTGNALAVGGTGGGYTYNWNSGAGTGSSFSQLCAGTNSLIIHDQNNCLFDTVFTINLQPISPNLVVTPPECHGECAGIATVAPTGGTGAFTFDWSPGSPQGDGTNSVSQLCPGNYSVLLTDANGCDTTVQFTITSPPPVLPNETHTNAVCSNTCNGTADVAPSGGGGNYQFIWSPSPGTGQFTAHVTGLCAGIWSCTIIDTSTGCDTTVQITVTSPPAIDPHPSSTNANCSNTCDGTATVAPTGGTPLFGFVWSPQPPVGQNTASASQLCPGNWSVTITDAAGCDTTVQFNIAAPPPILPNATHTDASCNGVCDGTADAPASGGTAPYTYVWTPNPPVGQGTSSVAQLCAGDWHVTISDAHGCDTTVTITIAQPPPLLVAATQTNGTCGATCNGTANVVVSGGTPTYAYIWTPAPGGGQGTANATGLCAGGYSVLITDAHNCPITQQFTILAPVPLQPALQTTNATCPNFCNGTASVVVLGGSPQYTYDWQPAPGGGQGTANATGLCAGGYTLTVTDSVGCDSTIAFNITAPAPIIPTATVINATCFGQCNGSVVLAPSGGNGSYTYSWSPVPSNGQGSVQALGLCAGAIQVTIASGVCDTTIIFQITAPPPIDAGLTTTPVTCANNCDGTATANTSGGAPGYTWLWTPAPGAGQGTANASAMCTGSYTLTITDAANCDTTIAFTIDAPLPIVPNLTTTLASCGGGCDGTATVAPTGGTGGYTITWSPAPGGGQGTMNATGMCPGAWSVLIADSAGCDTTVQFVINTPSGIAAAPQITNASCADVCNGAIALSVSGGVPAYVFTWSPQPAIGQGTNSVSGLCAGDWTVVISDQAGCDTVLVITVGSPSAIIPNGTFTNESCNGPCDGTADVNPSGGAGIYSYQWTPTPGSGQGTSSVGGLCAGDWSVTITDAGGCDTTWSFTVLPEQPIIPNLTSIDATCFNFCNGTAAVAPVGGIGAYTIHWSPNPPFGQGTANISGLCIGQWSVMITDGVGCDTTVSFLIGKPAPINPNLVIANATCFGPCTGQAGVFPTGGVPGFTYVWTPANVSGQGTNIASFLCADSTYSITLTDANGCDTTMNFIAPAFIPIAPNASSTNVSCNGACDGSATIAPTGGEAPYTYDWSPGSPQGDGTTAVSGLCAGDWSVTITDANLCDTTITVTITEPGALDPSATVQQITCSGQCNGSVTLNTQGGSGTYSYNWSPVPPNGQGTNLALQLCAGDWTVTITDANACDTTITYTISSPLPIIATASVVESQCQLCNGSVTINASGGTGAFLYAWGPPLNITTASPTQQNLCAGIYSVIVQDANGCAVQIAVPVSDSDGESLTVTNGLTTCPFTCDGTASVAFNCSAPTCTVAWFDGLGNSLNQSTDSLSGLCAGIYLVEVTNGNGCVRIDTAQVIAPTPILVQVTSSPVSCANLCDGSATLSVSGGVPPFDVVWSPSPGSGQGTTSASGMCAGVYDIFVNDASGCQVSASVLIVGPQPISPNASVQDISCAGQCDGSIVLNTSGGTGAFTYVWNPIPPNGQGSNSATSLCAGNWSVTIADVNACDTTLTFIITSPLPLTLIASATASHCQQCDGTANIQVNGGSGSATVTWTDVNNNIVGVGNSLSGLCAGIYTVSVQDVNGCSTGTIVAVTDADGETITAIDGQTTCANNCDGSVSVTFNCINGPCGIQWFDMNAQLIAQNQFALTNLCIGTYLVQVTNGNGCITIDTAMVTPSQQIIPNITSSAVTCNGACDGVASVTPIGGHPPYQYTWSPNPPIGQGTGTASGLCAGSYSLLIADSTGCDTTVSVLITEPAAINVSAQLTDVSCSGACDGTIVLSPSGGTGVFTFNWTPAPPVGQGTNSVSQLCAGDWTVTISDVNACDTTITYTITQPQPLSLSTSSTQSTCGVCSGSATVVASGGTGPYTYSWSQSGLVFGTNSTITSICAGFYTITVTDAHGCQTSAAVPVSDIDGEVVTTTNDIVTCPGFCDGEVSANFNCGTPLCTVAWFDAFGTNLNNISATLDSLCAGSYFVEVINGSGCITIDTAMVQNPQPMVANLTTVPATCAGSCDGIASVAPTGGMPPYTYLWSPQPPLGQGTAQAGGLCAGTWDLFITDSVGCSISVSALITEPLPVTATAVIDSISCNSICDGGITLTAQGGNGTFTYTWTPTPPVGDGTAAVSQLCAGPWSVHIQDTNGCDTTYVFNITEPAPLAATVTSVNNACFGQCQGTANATVSGGTPPYNVTWSTNGGVVILQGDTAVAGLCAGDYVMNVVDAHGCSFTQPFSITQGNAIVANLTFTGETCNGPCDGTATVAPSGGSGSFTYTWTPQPGGGQGTTNATGLCAGNWSVTITDSLGCDSTYNFTIIPYTPISPNAVVQQVTCNGAGNGTITLSPTGGIGNYTYTWNPVPPNGQGTNIAGNLDPQVWSVTITDAANCDTTISITITQPPALTLTVDQVVDASCATANDGSISITVGGGTPNLGIGWTGPGGFTSAQEDISGLAPGSYNVTVTDANNCTLSQQVTVNALNAVTANAGTDTTACFGTPITLNGSGSVGGTSFVWSDGDGNVVGNALITQLGALAPGTYTYILTVTDGPCSSSDQMIVTILALPAANAGLDQSIFLGATVTLGGQPSGPPGSSFLWSPDSLLSQTNIGNPTTSPLATSWYTLVVTAQSGCTNLDSVLITVIPEINIPSGFTPNGDGANDTWVIDFIDQFPDCTVEIFNRWGTSLFKSVGYKVPWDGQYAGGFVPVGTYYYAIELNDPRFPDPYTGPLTVIR